MAAFRVFGLSLWLLIPLHRDLNTLLGVWRRPVKVTWKSKPQLTVTILLFIYFFQVCFVLEFFDGRSYLFGFEVVPLEWKEGVTGVICPYWERNCNTKQELRSRTYYSRSDSPFRKEIFASQDRRDCFTMFPLNLRQRKETKTRHLCVQISRVDLTVASNIEGGSA